MTLTFGSLFAGIGGFDLGLERAGLTPRWQVENDPYCQQILARHWPHVTRYGDIREVNFHELEPVDLICGGFPCQPVSRAGRRRGQADERWLWPHFADAVRVLRPRYVIVENVPGVLTVNDGRAMGGIIGDLADCGYSIEWDCIPAAFVGAPHIRERVFIIGHRSPTATRRTGTQRWVLAHSEGDRQRPDQNHQDRPAERDVRPEPVRSGADVADTDGAGLPQRPGRGIPPRPRQDLRPSITSSEGRWAPEPDVGRVAHGVPHRVDRLRTLGNAVVPQVAEYIARQILEADRQATTPRPS